MFWIVTGTLTDGKRRDTIHVPDCGVCPACRIVASKQHMFSTCPMAQGVWLEADQLGSAHWHEYKDFDYQDIPNLLCTVSPVNVFKVTVLWALWKQWLHSWSEMIDQGYAADLDALRHNWLSECMLNLKTELIFRLAEAPAVGQWLEVQRKRGLARHLAKRASKFQNPDSDSDFDPDDMDVIPEKEFLLTVALQINTNPITLPSEEDCPYLYSWLGNRYLVNLKQTPHPTIKDRIIQKMVFDHTVWLQYVDSPDEEVDPRDAFQPFGAGPAFFDIHDY